MFFSEGRAIRTCTTFPPVHDPLFRVQGDFSDRGQSVVSGLPDKFQDLIPGEDGPVHSEDPHAAGIDLVGPVVEGRDEISSRPQEPRNLPEQPGGVEAVLDDGDRRHGVERSVFEGRPHEIGDLVPDGPGIRHLPDPRVQVDPAQGREPQAMQGAKDLRCVGADVEHRRLPRKPVREKRRRLQDVPALEPVAQVDSSQDPEPPQQRDRPGSDAGCAHAAQRAPGGVDLAFSRSTAAVMAAPSSGTRYPAGRTSLRVSPSGSVGAPFSPGWRIPAPGNDPGAVPASSRCATASRC